MTHDAVDRWMHPKCLTNYRIKNRKGFELLVGWQAEGAVKGGEMFNLFLVDLLADKKKKVSKRLNSDYAEATHAISG
jgi:hypothetical protein